MIVSITSRSSALSTGVSTPHRGIGARHSHLSPLHGRWLQLGVLRMLPGGEPIYVSEGSGVSTIRLIGELITG